MIYDIIWHVMIYGMMIWYDMIYDTIWHNIIWHVMIYGMIWYDIWYI